MTTPGDDRAPPPPRLRPMLAQDGGSGGFDDPGWMFEIKWDGVRALATIDRVAPAASRVRLVSRAGNDITAGYPEIAALSDQVRARNAVLDGELVALGPDGRASFQRLQRRMHVRDPLAIERIRGRVPVTYMVFDLLAVDGASIVDRPLTERLAALDEVLDPTAPVRRSSGRPEQGRAMFAAAAEHGLEGLIAKRLASRYWPGRRSRDWLKLKVRRRANVVIGGWVLGEGRRAGRLGSVLVGAYESGSLRLLGKVGTGFDAAELDRLEHLLTERAGTDSPFARGPGPPPAARWAHPELVCRVEYAEVTDDGVLRAPAYKGLLPDVPPRACLFEDLLA